jgi:hypothetical protein
MRGGKIENAFNDCSWSGYRKSVVEEWLKARTINRVGDLASTKQPVASFEARAGGGVAVRQTIQLSKRVYRRCKAGTVSGCQTPNCRTVTTSHLFKAKTAAHGLCPMSAFGGKADMALASRNVRL